jgi:signal transduction histidine kinase
LGYAFVCALGRGRIHLDLTELKAPRGEDREPESGAASLVAAAEAVSRNTERKLDAILLAVYPHRKFKADAASLNEVIQKEVEAWKGTLPSEPKIEFSVSFTSFTCDFDVFQWQTLIQHLLRKACKALPNGGRVQMGLIRRALDEAGAAEIGVKPGPFGVMTWQDDGCGMTAETLQRCCEPFFSTQPKNKAAGLGLTTAHSIARLPAGQTLIRSAEGKGSTVEIWTPLN